MGLVTCEKCKKIYDYDKYNGICPKCTRYNRESSSAQEHQEYHNKYDGGYSHTAQDNHHSYHQRYDSNKNPHDGQLGGVQETLREVMEAAHKLNLEPEKAPKKMDKKAKTVIGFILVMIFFMPFLGPFLIVAALLGAVLYSKRKK